MICMATVGTPPMSVIRSLSMTSKALARIKMVHHHDFAADGGARHQNRVTARGVKERDAEQHRVLRAVSAGATRQRSAQGGALRREGEIHEVRDDVAV